MYIHIICIYICSICVWFTFCFTSLERVFPILPFADIVFIHISYIMNFILILYHTNISKILLFFI